MRLQATDFRLQALEAFGLPLEPRGPVDDLCIEQSRRVAVGLDVGTKQLSRSAWQLVHLREQKAERSDGRPPNREPPKAATSARSHANARYSNVGTS